MGLFQLVERNLEGTRDRFLDEAFAQSDAEVAGQDLDQVLCFEWGELLQARLEQFRLAGRAACFVQRFEERLRLA